MQFLHGLMPRTTYFILFSFFNFILHAFDFVLHAFSVFPVHMHTLSVDTSPLWEKIELQGAKK